MGKKKQKRKRQDELDREAEDGATQVNASQATRTVDLCVATLPEGKVPIVYRPEYNISFLGLERLHPFDSQKYARAIGFLTAENIIKADQYHAAPIVTSEQLAAAHRPEYLESLQDSGVVASITEIPPVAMLPQFVVQSQILTPFQYAVGGTIAGARIAIEHKWAINMGGGFHHCCAASGGGFCAYADITLAVQQARSAGKRRVLIVDLDAHQGNGHERDSMGDAEIYTLDMFNHEIYPGDTYAERAITDAVKLSCFTEDDVYLPLLGQALHRAMRFRPEFVVFVAGTDCLEGDPLGQLSVSAAGIVRRDEMVFEAALMAQVPVLMLLAGGYQQSNARVIADSITNVTAKFDLLPKVSAGSELSDRSCPADGQCCVQ